MSEKKTLQITDPEHLIVLGRVLGLLTAVESIKDAQIEVKLPGLGVARHAVTATEASTRVEMMQANLRLAYSTWGSLEGFEVHCTGGGLLSLTPVESSPGKEAKRAED